MRGFAFLAVLLALLPMLVSSLPSPPLARPPPTSLPPRPPRKTLGGAVASDAGGANLG